MEHKSRRSFIYVNFTCAAVIYSGANKFCWCNIKFRSLLAESDLSPFK
jgi:hypothetical protein